MWGLDIEELSPKILARVPIRDDLNDLYFPDDKYQFMPKHGYTEMVRKILDHEKITVFLNKSFCKSMEENYDHIFSAQPIDEYYDFKFGELPYRSIKFKNSVLNFPALLPVPTVNFTNDGKYTRVTEWKKYPNHGQNEYQTILTFEEPCDYKDNNFERYYPVKDVNGSNRELYEKYQKIKNSKVTFIGRCGLYVYLDMHQAINSSLATAMRFIQKS